MIWLGREQPEKTTKSNISCLRQCRCQPRFWEITSLVKVQPVLTRFCTTRFIKNCRGREGQPCLGLKQVYTYVFCKSRCFANRLQRWYLFETGAWEVAYAHRHKTFQLPTAQMSGKYMCVERHKCTLKGRQSEKEDDVARQRVT
jgi:hypothetical protein